MLPGNGDGALYGASGNAVDDKTVIGPSAWRAVANPRTPLAAPIGMPETGSPVHAGAVRMPGTEDAPDGDVRTSHASPLRMQPNLKASSRASPPLFGTGLREPARRIERVEDRRRRAGHSRGHRVRVRARGPCRSRCTAFHIRPPPSTVRPPPSAALGFLHACTPHQLPHAELAERRFVERFRHGPDERIGTAPKAPPGRIKACIRRHR